MSVLKNYTMALKALLSYIYGLGLKIWYLYDETLRVKSVLPVKRVISIGNITLGGTGKTPLTIYLAEKLSKERKVAILTRGYKRKGGTIEILYGSTMAVDWKRTGDEPYLMWKKLNGEIPIVVGKDRYETGKIAIRQFGVDTILLDDGFQYLPLERDIDIVCINQKTVLEGDRLFPWGTLREDFSALKRATILVLNVKSESLNPKALEKLDTFKKPVFVMKYIPQRFYNFEGQQFSLQGLRGFDVAVLTGIADPHSFLRILESLQIHPKEKIIIRDHDAYPLDKLRALLRKYDYVITTEKDLIKYPLQKNLLALEIKVQIEGEDKFLSYL